MEPTHLDLFSGIGGFALAAKWAGFRTIGFCEIDKYCQKVLVKNFDAHTVGNSVLSQDQGRLDMARNVFQNRNGTQDSERSQQVRAAIHSNIFDLDGTQFRGVNLITGGFPCQPFSVAGKRRGAADDRAIWPEMFRVIEQARPAWVLGENVPGIIPMELDNVLSDLESIGYACRSFVIPACAVDARHRRDRLWIVCSRLADCEELRLQESQQRSLSSRQNRGWQRERRFTYESGFHSRREWLPEPNVGGTFDGLSRWLDGFGGLNGASKVEFASEAVCPLWSRVLAQELREPARFSPEKVLLAFVCKLKRWPIDEARIQLACAEISKAELRGVRYNEAASCPSCRSRHSEQHVREHPDFVQVVSRFLARYSEKAWIEYRRSDACSALGWETGFARVAHGVEKRVDRLKGLGNAIVPQVAYEILVKINEIQNHSR